MSEAVALQQPNRPVIEPSGRQPDHKPLQDAVQAQDKALWTVHRLQLERQAATDTAAQLTLDQQVQAALQDYDTKTAVVQTGQASYLDRKTRADRFVAGTATVADRLEIARESAARTQPVTAVPPAIVPPAPVPPAAVPAAVPPAAAPQELDDLRQRFEALRPNAGVRPLPPLVEVEESEVEESELEDEAVEVESLAGLSENSELNSIDSEIADLARTSQQVLELLETAPSPMFDATGRPQSILFPAVPTTPLLTVPVAESSRPRRPQLAEPETG